MFPYRRRSPESARIGARKALNLGADLVEHRLDYIRNLNKTEMRSFLSGRDYNCIVTNRKKGEGGFFEGPEDKGVGILVDTLEWRPEHVDIELKTSKALLASLVKSASFCSSKIIVSTHFTKYTPKLEELIYVHKRSVDAGADIVKIVTFANCLEDNQVIYRLIEESHRKDVPIIALAMGPIGRDTRILSVKMGAYTTYPSLAEGRETAPGQVPIEEMKRLLG